MKLMSCAAVRRRLAAYYDRELPVPDLIDIETHLNDCRRCVGELGAIEAIGASLRLVAAPAPADDWTGLQPGVISRMRAEQQQSWSARVSRMFDDLHLVWIGLASTTATFLCAAAVLSMLHLAAAERRADSLAALIAVYAAPYGSDINPIRFDSRISVPTVPENGVVFATLENATAGLDCEVAMAAQVSREGLVSGLELLGDAPDQREAAGLLRALAGGRLEPARFSGEPAAVNLVWLVAHTTVKGKYRS